MENDNYTAKLDPDILKELSKSPIPSLKPSPEDYNYLKGFHDATVNLMQTFNRLLDSGALNGTKPNTRY